MITWTPITTPPPLKPLQTGATMLGGDKWTGWVLGLFPHDPETPVGYPDTYAICGISYPDNDDRLEWFQPIDAAGGLDQITSHGYPGPTHWAALPEMP